MVEQTKFRLEHLEETFNKFWRLTFQFPELIDDFERKITIENLMVNPFDKSELVYQLHFNFCKYLDFDTSITDNSDSCSKLSSKEDPTFVALISNI